MSSLKMRHAGVLLPLPTGSAPPQHRRRRRHRSTGNTNNTSGLTSSNKTLHGSGRSRCGGTAPSGGGLVRRGLVGRRVRVAALLGRSLSSTAAIRCPPPRALNSSSGAEVPSGSTGYRFPMSDLFLSKEELAKFANVDFSKLAPGEKPPWVQDSQVRAQDEEDWWWRSSCCSAPHDVC